MTIAEKIAEEWEPTLVYSHELHTDMMRFITEVAERGIEEACVAFNEYLKKGDYKKAGARISIRSNRWWEEQA